MHKTYVISKQSKEERKETLEKQKEMPGSQGDSRVLRTSSRSKAATIRSCRWDVCQCSPSS